MWGYLNEFWSSIVQVGDYTIDFFQSIGNAVAGAVGNLFEFLNHSISDLFVFASWLFYNLSFVFSQMISPVKYIFQYIKSFSNSAFANPEIPDIYSFGTSTKEIINSIPYWNVICLAITFSFLVIAGISIFKLFTKA